MKFLTMPSLHRQGMTDDRESGDLRSRATPDGVPGAPPPRLHWPHLILWLPACVLIGAGFSWAAFAAQSLFSPFVLFPLFAGLALGACPLAFAALIRAYQQGVIMPGIRLEFATESVFVLCGMVSLAGALLAG